MSTEAIRVKHDDPRLTTYALGEMAPAEREAFQAEIEGDDEARGEIEAIREAAGVIEAELKRAPTSLGEAQRAAIAAALEKRAASSKDERAPEPSKASKASRASKEEGNVVSIEESSRERASRLRVLWLAVPAVAAAAALFMVGETGERGDTHVAKAVAPAASAPSRPMSESKQAAATAAPGSGLRMNLDVRKRKEAQVAGDHGSPAQPGPVTSEVAPLPENTFVDAAKDPKSTFSIDVDTASYAIMRRSIETGSLPPAEAVRVEELVNYFPYADVAPVDEAFGVTTAVAAAPWAKEHRLLRVGVKGRDVPMSSRPASNLVFLLDVSGSMTGPDRLGLVKEGLKLLVRQLDDRDHVSIVVYAGAAGLVLPPTPGSDKRTILDALDRLEAGGSTAGAQGIQLAYEQAAAHFVQGGTNRVLLATDGDFNVGVSGKDELVALAQEKAKGGVFLTVLGFGSGNLRDSTLEQVADKANGQYAYIDSLGEAKKVLVEQAAGTLLTIAKDVKIQMTFDPEAVASFRLIGYENRVLAHSDFTNDKKDAGDVGAGHTVTALYEIVPKSAPKPATKLGSIALRFKMPDGATSRQVDFPVVDDGGAFESAPVDLRFAAAVAGFGMKLRGSKQIGDFTLGDAARIAEGALGDDVGGHRRGFVTLAQKAQTLGR